MSAGIELESIPVFCVVVSLVDAREHAQCNGQRHIERERERERERGRRGAEGGKREEGGRGGREEGGREEGGREENQEERR